MDTIKIYKVITIDLKAERERISQNEIYTEEEQKALLQMIDAFENGDIPQMDKIAKSVRSEYSLWEYIGEDINDVVHELTLGYEFKIGNFNIKINY